MKKLTLAVSLYGSILGGCSSPPANEPELAVVTSRNLETTAQWSIASDHAIKTIAVASTGNDAAIAYGESEGWTGSTFTQTRIKLQRLDSAGKLRGAPIELGLLPFGRASTITIATDSERYFVCWNGDDDKISCASAPTINGNATDHFSATGRSPALAFGPAGLVLARATMDAIVAVPLHANGTTNGAENTFPFPGAQNAPILLVGKESGYTLVGESDGKMRVQKLDANVKKDGVEIDLGLGFWFHATMAQSETNLAIGLAIPYGMHYFVLNDSAIIGNRQYDDTVSGKTGINAALVPDGAIFGMLSPAMDGGLIYGLVDNEGTNAPDDAALKVEGQNFAGGSLQTFTLQGEPYIAASPSIPHQGGSIVVAHANH